MSGQEQYRGGNDETGTNSYSRSSEERQNQFTAGYTLPSKEQRDLDKKIRREAAAAQKATSSKHATDHSHSHGHGHGSNSHSSK